MSAVMIQCECGQRTNYRAAARGHSLKGWPRWGCDACGREWIVAVVSVKGTREVRVIPELGPRRTARAAA